MILDVRSREQYEAGRIPGALHRFWKEDLIPEGKPGEGLLKPNDRLEQEYRRTFQANRGEMPRIARLLAGRKLRLERGRLAEYEVTEDGKTFTLVFELVDGQWRLLGL